MSDSRIYSARGAVERRKRGKDPDQPKVNTDSVSATSRSKSDEVGRPENASTSTRKNKRKNSKNRKLDAKVVAVYLMCLYFRHNYVFVLFRSLSKHVIKL